MTRTRQGGVTRSEQSDGQATGIVFHAFCLHPCRVTRAPVHSAERARADCFADTPGSDLDVVVCEMGLGQIMRPLNWPGRQGARTCIPLPDRAPGR